MFASPLLVMSLLFLRFIWAQDYGCSKSKKCASGCCGPLDATGNGSCGLGPTFCGAGNCTSTCDQKAECNPGWGAEWSTAEKCPLNVCCSKYGFCGTTKDFCGDAVVKRPSCGGSSSNQRTIGYYEAWSLTRSCNTMEPEEIPAGGYTHLNFAFAFIDPASYKVAPMNDGQIPLYKRVTGIKNFQPGLQVWISIGGWSMNNANQPTHATFSKLAASTTAQQAFFSSLLSFMQTYGFDGIDVDWEYPVAEDRSGSPNDFENYVTFLQNLRKALSASGHKYGLSITIPSSYWYLRHFDIVNIARTIDWFNMMSYDLHGTWDSTVKSIGSTIRAHTNLTEINQALELLWRNDVDPGQVVLGLGFYGRSFTLSDPSCSSPGCPFSGGGNAGPCTSNVGTLSYDEITDIISKGATVTLDKEAAVKQVTWDTNQWVSYDDKETLAMKVDYANKRCLGGTMVWAVSQDVRGAATAALSSSTDRQELTLKNKGISDNSQSCFITDCSKDPTCPFASGFSAVQQTSGKAVDVNIGHGCPKGQKRTYCCPTNDMPTCHWRGDAPTCGPKGHCHSGEMQLTYDTGGCITGHKVLCCTNTKSDEARSKCEWKGTAPLCSRDNKCPSDHPREIARSNTGDNQKRFCCTDPPPFTGCDWYTHGEKADSKWRKCDGRCPANKQLVATDSYCFLGGTRAFCCDPPATAKDAYVAKFRDELQNVHDNLPCSAKEQYPYKREVQEGALTRRDVSSDLFAAITVLLNSRHEQSYIQQQYMSVFDEVWEDKNLNTSSFNDYMDWMDVYQNQEGLAVAALCEGDSATDELLCVEDAEDTYCEIPGSTSSIRRSIISRVLGWVFAPSETWLYKRRFIEENGNPGAGHGGTSRITTGRIMQAVIDNRIPLLYQAQLAYHANPANGPFQDVEMEVVYDIRGHPDLQEDPADIFAVFHFHTAGLIEENGVRYPAITDMNVYHARTVFQNNAIPNPTGDWVADFRQQGNGQINQRTGIFNCRRANARRNQAPVEGPLAALLAGNPHNIAPSNTPVNRQACVRRVSDFTTALFNRGILSEDAYTWWNGVDWTHREGNSPNFGPHGAAAPHPVMSTFPHT